MFCTYYLISYLINDFFIINEFYLYILKSLVFSLSVSLSESEGMSVSLSESEGISFLGGLGHLC